jgi:acyl-homoserine-lactone acylase
MIRIFVLLFFPCQLVAQAFSASEINRWQRQASQVTIIRDNWGIPHVYGKTDADCVFGLMYAQCEDDFKRIERNYIEILGRSAEILPKISVYDDLFIKLLVDSSDAISDYKKSPPWLQKLLIAFSDGINYYLYKNPGVKPSLLSRFEPWYPLMWTDGSISAIQSGGVNESELEKFYDPGNSSASTIRPEFEQDMHTGSNGFAIAPSRTASGYALLYINPHVTFYFRPEVHMVSEEGLNAYGAVTWGQFFVYQGFNEHCGWMHTSGYSDVADLYEEEVTKKGDSFYYRFDEKLLPLKSKEYNVGVLKDNEIRTKKITAFFTHHGPIMAKRNGKWISVKANNRSLDAIVQSWNRTKSKNFMEFKKNLALASNCSNNTMYADDKGNIAYWHGNFIPRRDTAIDWNEPVNGTISSTEWKGLHSIDEIVHLYNPVSGWIQNCNSTPFSASGKSSPNKNDYPFYMATEPENFRGINAVRILSKEKAFSIDKLIAAGYDTYLAAFEQLVPALVNAYEKEKINDSLYALLQEPVSVLKQWNLYAYDSSIATTLAIYWGQKLQPAIAEIKTSGRYSGNVERFRQYAESVPGKTLMDSLHAAIIELKKRFGDWRIPWGKLNRYQRLTGELRETYDDSKSSLPVGMAPSFWGCLPSFVSRHFPGTNKRYGYSGNSFICAVEFGKKIKAKSLLAGGLSSNPHSRHFGDQAEMYTKGQFKDVLFYKEDVLKNAERSYHPGD